jgi:hypothetical protein
LRAILSGPLSVFQVSITISSMDFLEIALTGALTQMLSLSTGTRQLLREPYSSS